MRGQRLPGDARMPRHRPARLTHIAGIGVDRMGAIADDAEGPPFLRLENLDVDI
eukprot:gene873-1009_t